MSVGIKRDLRRARDKVAADIAATASHGRIASAMSGEGYAGGYRDALSDVMQALNGCPPSYSRYWPRKGCRDA